MTTLPQNFQFIGGYDNRFGTSTIAASDAHKMATRTAKPRAPKAHSIEEIKDRAVRMGVTFEMSGKTIYLTPSGTSDYHTTDKKNAWQVLDSIYADTLAKTSDANIASQASAARELISAF